MTFVIDDLKRDYPLLYKAAKTEHENGSTSPSGAEAEAALYELWLARTNNAPKPTCERDCVCGDVTLCGTADPDLLSVCPKCGALVEDLDGFGVLAHLGPGTCGYCSHFDVYGDECRVCGATVGAAA